MNNLDSFQNIDTNNLLFDYQNPRLSEFSIDKGTSQEEILEILWEAMDVKEIVYSIATSGFFRNDPLIITSENRIDNKYVVIEGNRRLAAVKAILNEPFLLEKLGKNHIGISDDIYNSLNKIPCMLSSKEEAWQFIGFKHVNGPAKWGSYAKAKYIAEVHKDFNIPIEQIAQQIGDTQKIAKRLYQAYMVIDQAEKENRFDRTDVQANRLFFSHLYNGLQLEGIKEFIALPSFEEENHNPISKDKLHELEEVLTWLYGSKKKQKQSIIGSQNPDLGYLSESLKSQEAVAALRSGISLHEAHEMSLPDDGKFLQSLNTAKRELLNVQKYLSTGYDGESKDTLQTAATIANLADDIYDYMNEKHLKKHNRTKNKRIVE